VTGGGKPQNPLDVLDASKAWIEFVFSHGIADTGKEAEEDHHRCHLDPLSRVGLFRGFCPGKDAGPAR